MNFDAVIKAALKEDVGPGDITTRFFVPLGTRFYGEVVAKDAGIVCGLVVTCLWRKYRNYAIIII